MAKFIWKVWLRLNKLTDHPSDYVAEVDTAGQTRRQQDIIDRIMEEGSEVKPETIKAILDRTNAVKRDFLLNGYSVYDDFVHLTPRITGAWNGKESYTEGKHRATADAVLSKEVHEALRQVGVQVLGVAGSNADIRLVTDIATGKTDGTITPRDDIQIVGDKIKVVGQPQPDGSMEPGIGVFFMVAGTSASVTALRITENTQSKIVARVPVLSAGTYTLRIVTRFTRGGALLVEPREIDYSVPLIVKS
jgi:hypothetical protein